MNGNNILLDSNIIIYFSQGKIPIDELIREDKNYYISVITYLEVMGYQFEDLDEENYIQKLFHLFTIVYIDDALCKKVIEIRKNNILKLPDAIICATSLMLNATLYTNDKQLGKIKNLKTKNVKIKIS